MGNVAILGASGGRELEIARAIRCSPEAGRVVVAADPRAGLDAFSGDREKPLIIIGPEAPLVAGLADELRGKGYVVLGVDKKAAQYEASKSRAVKMMRKARVLHADTDISEDAARDEQLLNDYYFGGRVIKADGLAAGKGVVVPKSLEEARATVQGMRDGSLYNGAGKEKILFQKRHSGQEVSALVLVGGGPKDYLTLPLAQDYKRRDKGDLGPNTGGMGSYAPVSDAIVNQHQFGKIEEATYKSFWGMQQEGVLYERGVLYIGFMLSELEGGDPIVIEYNVRFGDPEILAILPLLQRAGVDIYRLLLSAAEGSLEIPTVDLSNLDSSAVTVGLAGHGYPGKPRTGDVIHGLELFENDEDLIVHPAAVKMIGNQAVTNGGRVIYVTGMGETVDQAAKKAYSAIGEKGIHFAGMQYRDDIAYQARAA